MGEEEGAAEHQWGEGASMARNGVPDHSAGPLVAVLG